ncbi:hypothetical protein LY78DRAFT_698113, partial [Colletotrichum sublineola]
MTDDEATWPATCAYFGHNPDERDGTIDHGVVLPGTKRKLRPVQMQDVYRTLKLATAKTTTDRGALLAHEMGVGKTMIYQAIIAVRRLAILSDQHARDHPEEHASATGRCGLGARPFGIQCACERDGLTWAIVKKARAGATLVVAPSFILQQTLREARSYFHDRLTTRTPRGTLTDSPFVHIVNWVEVVPKPTSRKPITDPMILSTCSTLTFTPDDEVEDLPSTTETRWLYTERRGQALLNTLGLKVSLSPTSDAPHEPSSILIIVTRQRVSQDKLWRCMSTETVALNVEGGRQAEIQYLGTYYFGLVVWDEAHQVRNTDSSLAGVLFEMMRRQARKPMFIAASGSPVTATLADLTLVYALLRGRHTKPEIEALREELKKANAALQKNPSPSEKLAAAQLLRGFIRRTSASSFIDRPIMRKMP